MKINHLLVFIISYLVGAANAFSQKKPIDHHSYDLWKKIEKTRLSPSGDLCGYEISPLKGDGYAYIYDFKRQQLDSIFRGKDLKISFDDQFIAFKVTPGYDTLRKVELKKIDKKKYPKDSLFIWVNSTDSLLKFPKLKQFDVAEDGAWLAYLKEENERPKSPTPAPKKWYQFFKKSPTPPAEWPSYKSDGNKLFLWSPSQTMQFIDFDVTDFQFSKSGKYLSFTQQRKGTEDSVFLKIIATQNGQTVFQSPHWKGSQLPSWDKNEMNFATLFTTDTTKNKQYKLLVHRLSDQKSFIHGDSLLPNFSAEFGVSEFRKPYFSEHGPYLFFGISNRIKNDPEDTLLESEKVKLDIWHYKDETIQPQQLVDLKNKKKENFLSVFQLTDSTFISLGNDSLQINVSANWPGEYILAYNRKPYRIEAQWKMPMKEDVYLVHIPTGEKRLLKKGVEYSGKLSPNGRFYTYFNPLLKQHFVLNTQTNEEWCLTCEKKNIDWEEDENGLPMLAGPEEVYGFNRAQNEFYLSSRFDLWQYDLENRTLLSLTKEKGATQQTIFKLNKWHSDSVFIDLSEVYITGFDTKTKSVSVSKIDNSRENGLQLLWKADEKLVSIERNKNATRLILRSSTLEKYPEITLGNVDFTNFITISQTNPQQKDYQWAKVDLIEWEVNKKKVNGLVYKPENYDPSQKYPLIVYYYELLSDNLHQHQAPRPSASTINPLEYAASGYLVLIPDIYYEPGKPAQSAFNYIMSGTDYVLKNYSIDEKRMGLQGQSWGGYQTLQMITMTNRFSAAMAGAPVGNMFSAYGGIRWGTGLNRQFQYESTQSRIGKTIWEAPERYFENSPLFHLPKVNTPLLMMHNDKDGAVPWYQGIEVYTAMRRLQKPCWLLNYNDDDHNLLKAPNRVDLAIRMRQFFDHYLMNAPAPSWLLEGIPAIDKGKKTGYELKD